MKDTLVFKGRIASGIGMYSELGFPSHADMPDLPADWPDVLCPGSLNIAIDDYPARKMKAFGAGRIMTRLDNRSFAPAISIPFGKIKNNSLPPTPSQPLRGLAQVWRCAVTVEKSNITFPAWVVRRIGSVYTDIIEVVSDKRLRTAFNLNNNDKVRLTMEGETEAVALRSTIGSILPRLFGRRAEP